jgi:nucleoside-diphosphate-sugar epimerase
VVDGVLRAAIAPGVSGEVINVATGGRISLNDLVSTMNAIVGGDCRPVYGPRREGDVRDSQADISKARALLGYAPLVGLEDGLRKTLDWCRSVGGTAQG